MSYLHLRQDPTLGCGGFGGPGLLPVHLGLGWKAPTIAAQCQRYERREVEISRTERGHLEWDVTVANGRLLIADFGVDWSGVKASPRKESLLAEWLNTFEQDPSYRLRILGYSDCVGLEKNNLFLRKGRAERVFALLGKAAQTRVISHGPAPLGTYVTDNATVEGRARNRSVVIEFHRESQSAHETCDNRIRTVTVWLNAFIPKDVPGLTRKVPDIGVKVDPSMAGKTMFQTSFGCGLTDQRSLSPDINASSRLHSEAKIDLDKPGILYQKHRIDPSVQVNCLTGMVECRGTSSTDPMNFQFLGVSLDNEVMIRVKGSQGPACPKSKTVKKVGQFLVGAKIDYEGTFFIKRMARNYVDIGFLGYVDLFPAYEFGAILNDSNPIHLRGRLPAPGSSPVTHLGTKQKVHFVRRLWLKCKDGKQVAGLYEKIIN